MSLTQCPECKREVSTHAESCPSCGYPIASGSDSKVATKSDKTQLIEQSSKRYKLMQLVSGILIFGGIIGFTVGVNLTTADPNQGSFLGAVLVWMSILAMLVGIPLFFVARFLTWWKHG